MSLLRIRAGDSPNVFDYYDVLGRRFYSGLGGTLEFIGEK